MNPKEFACPNDQCQDRHQVGKSNIVIHSQKEKRLKCKTCGKTFSHRKGTAYYRLRSESWLFTVVVTLLAHGCPPRAAVAAFGLDIRTVLDWQERASCHCRKVHGLLAHLSLVSCQVQADEFCCWLRGRKRAWCAMALEVSTRFWLGGHVSLSRNSHLIYLLMCQVREALPRCSELLLATDGLAAYRKQFTRAFRQKVKTTMGRWRYQMPEGMVLLQAVKSYTRQGKRYTCHGVHKVVLAVGALPSIARLAKALIGTPRFNTSYIERLNATFRAGIAPIVRRGRCYAHRPEAIEALVWLKGTVYNFCSPHRSLNSGGGKQTPAMAAGLADHVWSVEKLLRFNANAKNFTNLDVHG